MYKISKFKNQKMTCVVSRAYVPLMSDYFLRSYKDPKNFKKFFLVEFFTRTGTINNVFYYGEESQKFGEVVWGKEKTIPGNTLASFKRVYVFGEGLLKYSLKINQTDFSKYSEKKLLTIFKDFSKQYITFATALMGFNIQYVVEDKLGKVLVNDPSAGEKIAILTFPDRQNISVTDMVDILRLRVKLDILGVDSWSKVDKKTMNLLRAHVKKYGWINARGALGNAWTEKNIFERALGEQNFKERLVELENGVSVQKKQTVELLKEINANNATRYLVAVAKELVYFRTYRTDYLNWIFFNVRPLLSMLAKKRGTFYDDLIYYKVDEILAGKKVSMVEIDRRKKGYSLMLVKPHKLWFSSDPKKIALWREKYTVTVESSDKEVKGSVAFKGVIKGVARVVKNKDNLSKVVLGDVLVTTMTTPDMVQAMQKAVAFVTDEGGITCHAAIIAREMKKPCVIGTKIATQIFKDGDMVEVDAEKGIVRKI